MTRVAVHQPDFLPYPGFFRKMVLSDVFVLYDTAQYSRRGYHNRNRIKTSRGVSWITVPVRVSGFPPIREVLVDNAQDWPRRLWKRIEVNYGRAPYFDDYAADLGGILRGRRWERLAELNVALLELVRRALSIDTPLLLASGLPHAESDDPTAKILGLTRSAGGNVYLSGPGGVDYLDRSQFRDVGLEFSSFEAVPYPQLWGRFAPNLSILDALFNCGPRTRSLLTAGGKPARTTGVPTNTRIK